MDTVALKKAIRREKLKARKALSNEEISQKSQEIFLKWRGRFSLKPIAYLHLFQTILNNKEIDTSHIMQYAWERHPHVELVIPVVNPLEGTLDHVILNDEVVLEENKWGIPEPVKPYKRIYPASMDMVLAPMLAFDMEGNRLGYGKGYYDKFLSLVRPKCLIVGLCLEAGKVEEGLPTDEFDIPMDFVVTENLVYKFCDNTKAP